MFLRYLVEIVDNVRLFLIVYASVMLAATCIYAFIAYSEDMISYGTLTTIIKRIIMISTSIYLLWALIPEKKSLLMVVN